MTMNSQCVAFFIFFSLSIDLIYGLKGYRRSRLLPERMKKAQKQTDYAPGFPDQWHTQRLDHLNDSSTEYGKLKSVYYYVLHCFIEYGTRDTGLVLTIITISA